MSTKTRRYPSPQYIVGYEDGLAAASEGDTDAQVTEAVQTMSPEGKRGYLDGFQAGKEDA